MPRIALAVCLLAAGCSAPAPAPSGETSSGDEDAAPDDTLPRPELSFDGGSFVLRSDRRNDIMLRATGITPGRTFALLDGVPLLAAGAKTSQGSLQDGLLVLHLDGALAEGAHRLELVTNGEAELLRSSTIQLEVQPRPLDPAPSLTLGPPRGTAAPADALVVGHRVGHTDLGLLRAADPDAGLVARIAPIPRDTAGWQLDALLPEATLPGYDPGDLEVVGLDRSAGIVSLRDLSPRAASPDDASFELLWRADLAGNRVLTRDAQRRGASEPSELMDLRDWVAPGTQRLRLEGLAHVGEDVVVAYVAGRLAEDPRPGDRALLLLSRPEPSASLGLRGPVRAATTMDLDALDAVDFSAAPDAARPRLGVRLGGQHAAILAADGAAPGLALRSPAALTASADFPGIWRSRLLFLGALGSVTAVGLRPDGTLRVVSAIDPTGERRRRELEPSEPTPPSGPAAGAILGGLVVVLVPYGDDAPVRAYAVAGAELRAIPIDELFCDELALDARDSANDEAATDLACLRAGEVTVFPIAAQDL